MKLKEGDTVQVISGKDRGKRGTVVRVFPAAERIIVEGVNMTKRHRKPKKDGEQGERVEFAAPIHVSNVMVIDGNSGKPTRIGYTQDGGQKVRISRRSGKVLTDKSL